MNKPNNIDLERTEDAIQFYQRTFAPYFAEYASLSQNEYETKSSTDVHEMIRAAREHGVDVMAYPSLPARRMVLANDKISIGFAAAQPSRMKPALDSFCSDKLIQKEFYEFHRIPHARGHRIHSLQQALETRASLGQSVVVKPSRGRQGIGVTVGIRDDATLTRAWEYARGQRAQSPVMMEETFVGSDLRAFILDRKVICTYLKLPPNVIGDGSSTVAELVAQKNQERSQSPALRVAMIKLDEAAHDLVALQGLSMSDVPQKGKPVLIGLTQSVSSGGDLLPINGRLSASVEKVSCSVAEALDYDGPLGMDVLCRDFEEPHGTAIICETNPQPAMFGALYPPVGKSIDCPKAIVKHYFGDKPKKPKNENITICVTGALESEVEAFCADFRFSNEKEPRLSTSTPGEVKFSGTKSEASTLLAQLANTSTRPNFVDSAYIKKTGKLSKLSHFPLESGMGADRKINLDNLLNSEADKRGFAVDKCEVPSVLCLRKDGSAQWINTKLNGWFSEALTSPLGRTRLRHQLAMNGVRLSRELNIAPANLKGLKRGVARYADAVQMQLSGRNGKHFSAIVKSPGEALRFLQENLSPKTKNVNLRPVDDLQTVQILGLDRDLIAASAPGVRSKFLHKDWAVVVEDVFESLPSARLLSITCRLENPEMSPENQNWAVEDVSTKPNLASFGEEIMSASGDFTQKLFDAAMTDAI